MKSVIRQLIEFMGSNHESGKEKLIPIGEIAEAIGISIEDVSIAIGMMKAQDLMNERSKDQRVFLSLSEKGIREYESYANEIN